MLAHRRLAVSFVVARLKGLTTADSKPAQMLGYGLAFLSHTARPTRLGRPRRTLRIFRGGTPPLSIGADHFRTAWLPLSRADNIADAILASGTLPLMMERIERIDGAPAGHYVDGGIIDYQMDLAHADPNKVLFIPHYESRIVPRWFDKSLRWKKAAPHRPHAGAQPLARAGRAALPGKRIPSRKDFKTMRGDDAARLSAWRAALDASERMADEFRELVATGKLEAAVEAL